MTSAMKNTIRWQWLRTMTGMMGTGTGCIYRVEPTSREHTEWIAIRIESIGAPRVEIARAATIEACQEACEIDEASS